jgi:hypothetical protein
VVGEVTSDVIVEQEILGIKEFQGVRLLLATYGKSNISANYKMQIVTEDGKILCEDVVSAREIEDNKYYYLVLNLDYYYLPFQYSQKNLLPYFFLLFL